MGSALFVLAGGGGCLPARLLAWCSSARPDRRALIDTDSARLFAFAIKLAQPNQ